MSNAAVSAEGGTVSQILKKDSVTDLIRKMNLFYNYLGITVAFVSVKISECSKGYNK